MRSTPRPHYALLPLVLAALLVAAAPVPPTDAATPRQEAAPSATTDRLIVTLAATGPGLQSTTAPEQIATQLSADAGADLSYLRPLGGASHLMALASPRSYAEVAAIGRKLAATSAVLSAEPDTLVFPTRVPSDDGYTNFAWHLSPVAGGNYGANLPSAWDITTGAPGVITAIIDTGGLLSHEDLAGRTPSGNPGYDMIGDIAKSNDGDGRDPDPSDPGDYVTQAESSGACQSHDSTWHGSHVAGTIGARANNGKGMAGINWESPILHIRALGKCGGYISDIADGLRWAAGLQVSGLPLNPNPARVLNLSLGGSGSCSSYFQDAVDDAVALGAVVVVAAGNENRNASNSTPGNCANVITVAATAQNGSRASYSNYGAAIELAAPGGDTSLDSAVYSSVNSGRFGPEADSYDFYQGTSMATPHVAGIASLMLSANPNLSNGDVLSILLSTATAFPLGSSCAGICGAGIVNAGGAVEEAARRIRTVSFQSELVVADEGEQLVIPVALSIASNQTVSVPYTISGTAGAGDHNLTAGNLTFAPGVTSVNLGVSIVDDAVAESDETIVISLGPGARSALGTLNSYSVTIKDDDASPAITVSPSALVFGEQRVGTLSAAQSVTVRNDGELPLALSSIALSAGYSRDGGTCPTAFPSTLAKGASCTVTLRHAPVRTGARGGSLKISSNGSGPSTVALSGVGVIPALGFSPSAMALADQIVGGAGPTATLVLTNPGTAPLRIDAIAASGDYRVGTAGCIPSLPATLAPGASCSLGVGFTPQGGGLRAGAITVTSDVPGGPYSVRLQGRGLAPELSLDAASLNFGGQEVGTSSVSRTLTLANQGDAPLSLTAIDLSGAAFARQGGSCPTSLPATLAPGAGCSLQLGFAPSATQSYTGSLSVTSDGGSSSVNLAGVGTAGPAAGPMLSPASVIFAERVLPAATGARTVAISNQGAATMTVSAVTLAGAGFSLGGGSCGLPPFALLPGGGCNVEVSLDATATGAYSGTLSFISDAPGGPQVARLAGSVVVGAGAFSLEEVGLAATPYTLTLSFTVARALPADGAISERYSITADREAAAGDLVVAAGTIAFADGEVSREVSVVLDRLAIYGASFLVLDLDEPAGSAGPSPAASRSLPVPAEDYTLYVPVAWR